MASSPSSWPRPLALAACDDGAADDGRLRVVTTVAPIMSIVAAVAGDRAQIAGIVPEGTDSHTFEPRPSMAELLTRADVLYMNGLRLEEPTRRLAEGTLPDDAGLVELGDLAIPEEELVYDFSFPRSGGKPNPHLWTDPGLAVLRSSSATICPSATWPTPTRTPPTRRPSSPWWIGWTGPCAPPSPRSPKRTACCSPTTMPTRTSRAPTAGG